MKPVDFVKLLPYIALVISFLTIQTFFIMKRRTIAWGRGRPARRLVGHAAQLSLGLMLACAKKEVDGICTETCCGTSMIEYKYIKEIKNAEADYANGGFWLKEPINAVNGVIVCEIGLEKIDNLQNTFDPKNIPNSPFAYSVSGTIYQDINGVSIGGNNPIHYIRLGNVKKIK